MSKLVIVESPAKAKTIKKYLGKDFDVVASMGHIRDLPAAKLNVDVKNDFSPKYAIIKGKEKLVKDLKEKVQGCDKVYLATDPDREGEAISWHLAMILGDDAKKAKSSLMLELPYTSMFEGHDQYKWSVFRDLPAEKMYDLMQTEIFPFIKNLHGSKESTYSQYMSDAIFKIPTPQLLSKIVDALDNIYIDMAKNTDTDTKGDVYEHLLAKLSTAGVNGQFRTPRHIIRMMVELLDPKPEDTICDPACGTSGFLVSAGEYLKEKYHDAIFYNREKKDHYNNHMFFGYDLDRTMLRVGAMNMMTHGVDNPNISYRDSLSDQNLDNGRYSIILANPPFKGSLDYDTVSADLLKVCKTKKTELCF